jgi:hypothetical protein
MKREEITRMAKEAGFVGFDGDNGSLRRFAALVAAAEREACIDIVAMHGGSVEIEAAIRARRQA